MDCSETMALYQIRDAIFFENPFISGIIQIPYSPTLLHPKKESSGWCFFMQCGASKYCNIAGLKLATDYINSQRSLNWGQAGAR